VKLLRALCCAALLAAAATGQEPACCPGKPTAEKQKALQAKLEAEVGRVADALDGVMGVAILDLTSGDAILVHPDDVFAQASSIKIAVLAELYRQDQAGKGAKLDDTYVVRTEDLVADSDIMLGLTPGKTTVTNRDLATMMIAVSDNAATNVLIDRVGMQNVNSLLQSLTLTKTKLQRKMMDVNAAKEGRENLATPREFMMLMEAIYRGRVVNQQLTDELLKLLTTGKGSPIQTTLGENIKVADKDGQLPAVRGDFGIVYAPNRPFVISVLTTYLKNEREGEDAIGEIAEAAYSYFDRVGRSSTYGRAMSSPQP